MAKQHGFDITLADAIAKLDLTKDEIVELDRLTRSRGVAHSRFGYKVMYREATLKRLFNR